jgi:threonine/homoserine/homoserine lactone efflux protein
MEYLDNIIELILIFTAGLISPGPDFALIIKCALNNSRKTALLASLGIATGVLIHAFYILFGIGKLILNSSLGILTLSIVGGLYLSYLGLSGILADKVKKSENTIPKPRDMNPYKALFTGILTSLLNPKAIFFITSLLVSVVDIDDTSRPFLLYESILFLETLLWFSIVALFLSSPKIQTKARSIEVWISRVTGSILLVFGIKLICEAIF